MFLPHQIELQNPDCLELPAKFPHNFHPHDKKSRSHLQGKPRKSKRIR